MHTILRCTIVAHFTDKIPVYFTHFLAKIPNSSRNFFFQLLPVLILRQSLFSFDQKSTLPLIFSSFMYLPPHRHYYSNLSIQPEKCIFSRINKSTIVQTKKQQSRIPQAKKHPSLCGNPQKEGCRTQYPVVVPITACSYQQSRYQPSFSTAPQALLSVEL